MKTYFALFLIATTSSLVLTPLLRRFCERFGLVDSPRDDRRVHEKPIPRLGGVAVFISVMLALSSLLFVNNLLTQYLHYERRHIVAFLVCGTLVVLLGAYDDLRGANAAVKFAGLFAITALFYALGGRIVALSVPFIGGVNLPPVVGFLVTMIWIVGVTNAFNLIDGIDGLATGSALFSSLVLLSVSLMNGNALVAVITLVLSGALAGFLRYNFNPASIFLGDSGSLFVGFSLAAISTQGSQKASTAVAVAIPLLAFGLPVVDTGVALARRFISRKPLFQGDREHIHHMLLARGWSQRRVAVVLYLVSAVFGLLAMLFVNSVNSVTAVMLFVVGVAVVIAVGSLRYHEVDELRASVKRNIGDRRERAANNVEVRRSCRAVESAGNLREFFGGLVQILSLGDFVCAQVQLGASDNAALNERAIALSRIDDLEVKPAIVQGRINWTWTRNGLNVESVIGSDRFWCLRLPLARGDVSLGYVNLYREFDLNGLPFDVNYLTTIFQPAVTSAAERILRECEENLEQVAARA